MSVDVVFPMADFAPEVARARYSHAWLENQLVVPLRTRRAHWANLHARGKAPEFLSHIVAEAEDLQGFCSTMQDAYSPVSVLSGLFATLSASLLAKLAAAVDEQYRHSPFIIKTLPALDKNVAELVRTAKRCQQAWRSTSFEEVDMALNDLQQAADATLELLHGHVPRGIVLP